jgi:hypothetical protein
LPAPRRYNSSPLPVRRGDGDHAGTQPLFQSD